MMIQNEKKVVSWTINVEWSDKTKEDIGDLPNDVAQVVDNYLAELEE